MKRFFKSVSLTTMFIVLFGVCMLVVGAALAICLPNLRPDISLMLQYFCSMIAVYNITILIERMVFKSISPVYNSKVGFDPLSLLVGVVLIFAISIVLLPLESIISPDSRLFPEGIFTAITVIVLAPILEEMIFRARLYNILSRNTSPLMSASLSALTFGVVHLEPIVIIEALVVGVVLSYYYLSKRSIITPIILHACNNAFGYALVVLSYRGESLRTYIAKSADMHLALYFVCLLIVVVGAVVVIRFFIKEKQRARGVECQDMETIAEHYDGEQLVE